MPVKDIFDSPFDEGTIAKLEVFENYLKSWLPPIVRNKGSKPIQVFDFFSGSGYDINGVEGSPIRTLKTIKSF